MTDDVTRKRSIQNIHTSRSDDRFIHSGKLVVFVVNIRVSRFRFGVLNRNLTPTFSCVYKQQNNLLVSLSQTKLPIAQLVVMKGQCQLHGFLFNIVLGSLSTHVFETRTATESELFSLLTCPHTTTFTLLSIFSPLEMSSIQIWEIIRS